MSAAATAELSDAPPPPLLLLRRLARRFVVSGTTSSPQPSMFTSHPSCSVADATAELMEELLDSAEDNFNEARREAARRAAGGGGDRGGGAGAENNGSALGENVFVYDGITVDNSDRKWVPPQPSEETAAVLRDSLSRIGVAVDGSGGSTAGPPRHPCELVARKIGANNFCGADKSDVQTAAHTSDDDVNIAASLPEPVLTALRNLERLVDTEMFTSRRPDGADAGGNHPPAPSASLQTRAENDYGSLVDVPLEFIDTTEALARTVCEITAATSGESDCRNADGRQHEFAPQTSRALAVDLEHHSYRSYLGFTCLMQLSTVTKDYIIDTITLRASLGAALGPIFANPKILKVFHGADNDLLWLQRDFGIYCVGMFDTGQAARILGLKSCSYQYALQHYCRVQTDKKYQLADWRIRPLPEEMLRYARMDTHYLLEIYEGLRRDLDMHLESKAQLKRVMGGSFNSGLGDAEGKPSAGGAGDSDAINNSILLRSLTLCFRVYEKRGVSEDALEKLGRRIAAMLDRKIRGGTSSAIIDGLLRWRDAVARSVDESPDYILSNSTIAKVISRAHQRGKRKEDSSKGQLRRDVASILRSSGGVGRQAAPAATDASEVDGKASAILEIVSTVFAREAEAEEERNRQNAITAVFVHNDDDNGDDHARHVDTPRNMHKRFASPAAAATAAATSGGVEDKAPIEQRLLVHVEMPSRGGLFGRGPAQSAPATGTDLFSRARGSKVSKGIDIAKRDRIFSSFSSGLADTGMNNAAAGLEEPSEAAAAAAAAAVISAAEDTEATDNGQDPTFADVDARRRDDDEADANSLDRDGSDEAGGVDARMLVKDFQSVNEAFGRKPLGTTGVGDGRKKRQRSRKKKGGKNETAQAACVGEDVDKKAATAIKQLTPWSICIGEAAAGTGEKAKKRRKRAGKPDGAPGGGEPEIFGPKAGGKSRAFPQSGNRTQFFQM